MVNPVVCKIPIAAGHEIAVPLVDISADGIGVLLPDHSVPEIKKGAQFKDCVIDFPEVGVVQVTLAVENIWQVMQKHEVTSRHAGLEFKNIRPGTQSKVQGYINMLQRILIASKGKP